MDCVYYHFKTRNISEKWNTAEIGDFLCSTGLFPDDSFTSQKPYFSISLMNVKNYDWSGKDYDPEKTNYIGLVTSDDWYWGNTKNEQIQAVLDGLSALLHTEIQEDW